MAEGVGLSGFTRNVEFFVDETVGESTAVVVMCSFAEGVGL